MQTFGKYETLSKIGEGGFGEVWKGYDPFIKRFVAIKTCTSDDETLRRRFTDSDEPKSSLSTPTKEPGSNWRAPSVTASLSVRISAVSIADSICWLPERVTAVGSAAVRAGARTDAAKAASVAPGVSDLPDPIRCFLIMVVTLVGTRLPNWCEFFD